MRKYKRSGITMSATRGSFAVRSVLGLAADFAVTGIRGSSEVREERCYGGGRESSITQKVRSQHARFTITARIWRKWKRPSQGEDLIGTQAPLKGLLNYFFFFLAFFLAAMGFVLPTGLSCRGLRTAKNSAASFPHTRYWGIYAPMSTSNYKLFCAKVTTGNAATSHWNWFSRANRISFSPD